MKRDTAARTALSHLAETRAQQGFTETDGLKAIKEAFGQEGIRPQPRSNKDVLGYFEELESDGTIQRCQVKVENGQGGRDLGGWKRVPKQRDTERHMQFE
jgi:hypothetical protein